MPAGAGARQSGWAAVLAGAAGAWIGARFVEEAEAGRLALWLPVAFALGVSVYFAASNEPALWAAFGLVGATGVVAWAARRGFTTAWLALCLLFVALGFLGGKLATERATAPILAGAMRAEIVGRVIEIEPRARGMRRLTIEIDAFGKLEADARPHKARVAIAGKPEIAAGDQVSLTAFWRPPEGPVRPGGYDFARVAFFKGVGATGFGARDIRNLGPPARVGMAAAANAGLERLRQRLTDRVTRAIGGAEGTVAAALVTGVEGPIPQNVQDELRGAGLSHILSISGLHMALVAGALFWLARAALALAPRVALMWPVKQIAALVALAGATFYLALSGAEVATQRSYVMIAIAFLAIIVGRPALAPRNFALAALIVLAIDPESLMGPSFQMSFAAVAGLVAWFETRRDRPPAPPPADRFGRIRRKIAAAVALAIMTTLIAGFATGPFAAYHFHRVTPYAVVGNALAEPVIGLIVMPSVVAGLLLAPLGLDGLAWAVMGQGLSLVLAIAREVSSWPGAEGGLPAFGEGAMLLFAFGLAWLCLWHTTLRWFALVPLTLATVLAAAPARPDVAVDASGRFAAVRAPSGELATLGPGSGRSFAAKVWIAADGADPPPKGAASDVRCDRDGCVAPLIGGGLVALSWEPSALEEDCRRAALVVTRLTAPPGCSTTAAVIDATVLASTGSLSLFRYGATFKAVAARDPTGRRPWSGTSPSTAPPVEASTLTFSAQKPKEIKHADELAVDPTDDPEDEAAGEEDQ
ncbi:ComEC family competence protein [Hansschlegelia quercus]|uniref:ComEC family competence protein n=1 Tax=Hansschlegelia quercus TaxID=2528245 RepID=A0A4Q9GFM4_9HYPH|nr:ComEC family competence protein [Hansschlegelia quercus]